MTSNLIMYIIDSTDINIKRVTGIYPWKKDNTEKVVGIEYDIVLEAESILIILEIQKTELLNRISKDIQGFPYKKSDSGAHLMQYKYTSNAQSY